MFLSRRKLLWRAFFKEHFIDVWTKELQKGNFRRVNTQRFLQFFKRYISKRYMWIKGRKRVRTRRPTFQLPSPTLELPDFRKLTSRPQLPFFFMRAILNYCDINVQRAAIQPARVVAASFDFEDERRKRFGKRLNRFYRLKRMDHYQITDRMNGYYQAAYFGFSTLSSLRSYLRRVTNRNRTGYRERLGGVAGMFAHQIYRTGLFPNIRFSYNLIRAGGVSLNGRLEKRPRRLLEIGDTFMLNFPFSILMLSFYITRLELGLVWFGVPAYIDFNLDLMAFCIWRQPTEAEITYIPFYPFKRKLLAWGELKDF